MEGRTRRTHWRAAAVVIAVILAIATSWAVWDTLIRPRTICEVLEASDLRPGTEMTVEGTITNITRANTSYGPEVTLELDGDRRCPESPIRGGWVYGNPKVEYGVGNRFRTVLHFTSYRFNGDSAVWAPELAAPFPLILESMGVVWDAVSWVNGIVLLHQRTDTDGWTTYWIYTSTGDTYRPDKLPLTLRRSPSVIQSSPDLRGRASINSAALWIIVAALQYVLLSGGFHGGPIVDEMASLADGTSRNGTTRFTDVDGDGLVGHGDTLQVRLPDTGAEQGYDTYALQVGDLAPRAAYAYAGHYLLNGPHGPREFHSHSLLPDRPRLLHVGDEIGARVTSTIETDQFPPTPVASLGYEIQVGDGAPVRGNLSELPSTILGNISVALVDRGAPEVLETGDRFVLGNLPNRTYVSLSVRMMASIDWISGWGPVVGFIPSILLKANTSSPYRADVSVEFWHPELELNRTLRVSLTENATEVVREAAVVNGTLGAFANGTLSFVDADGDGYLSVGDHFDVQGSPAATYEIEVSLLFGMAVVTVAVGG